MWARSGVPDSANLEVTAYMKQKYKWQALALEDLDGWLAIL